MAAKFLKTVSLTDELARAGPMARLL